MRLQLVIAEEGQLDRPIVGKIERAPFRVVEFGRGKVEIAGLGKVAWVVAEVEIARGVGSVAEGELPPKVEEQLLAGRDSSQRGRQEAPMTRRIRQIEPRRNASRSMTR